MHDIQGLTTARTLLFGVHYCTLVN